MLCSVPSLLYGSIQTNGWGEFREIFVTAYEVAVMEETMKEQLLKEFMQDLDDDILVMIEELMQIEGNIHTHDELTVSILDALVDDGFALYDGHYYQISEDTKNSFKHLYTEAYKKQHKIQYQLSVCFDMAYELYIIVPIQVLGKIYNKIALYKLDEKEIMAYIKENKDIMEMFAIMNGEIIPHDLIQDTTALNDLRAEQEGKGHYIPKKDEILFYFETMELPADDSMEHLVEYLIAKVSRQEEREVIFTSILQVREIISNGGRMQDVVDTFGEEIMDLVEEDEMMIFFDMIREMWNHTRMVTNAGFTPLEVEKPNTTILH